MRLAPLALFLFSASALAQGVKGPTEVNVPIGRLAAIPLTVDADESEYVVLGDSMDAMREYDSDPKKLRLRVIGYAPGVSYVVVTSQKGGKLHAPFVVKVTVGNPGPAPVPPVPPGPQPGPGPNPAPVPAGKLYVVIVEESRGAAAARGLWFNDPKLSAAMKGKGHRLRCVDKDVKNDADQTPEDVKRFIDAARAGAVPMLFLVSEAGRTVHSGPLPATTAEMVELIVKYGG